MKKLLAIVVSALVAGCSPYAAQIKSLDKAYASGRISPNVYFPERARLLDGDAQWQANQQIRMQNMANAMNRQNEINAYNARTNVMAQPQRVNVYHSGSLYVQPVPIPNTNYY